MKQTKYSLDVPLSAMNNSTTSDKNSLCKMFSTVNARNLFSTVKAKQKYDEKPRVNCDLGMVSFLLKSMISNISIAFNCAKLILCRTYLLVFEKQNIKGICKLHMIFVTNKDPSDCSIRTIFQSAQQEISTDGMKLHYKFVNLYSPMTYLKTINSSLVCYKCLRSKGPRSIEKKKLGEISKFFKSSCSNSKNALMQDLNSHSSFVKNKFILLCCFFLFVFSHLRIK